VNWAELTFLRKTNIRTIAKNVWEPQKLTLGQC
jgi:hypothetical protein